MENNSNKRSAWTRRSVIKSATALAGAGLTGMWPAAASAQSSALETKAAKLGFIALTDAALLFVADEKGFFKKHGMTDVQVLKQSSWGTTRDILVLGSKNNGIDGAHPDSDALSDQHGGHDSQQCADADVYPGAS